MTTIAHKPEPVTEITREQLVHLLEVLEEENYDVAKDWLRQAIKLADKVYLPENVTPA